VDVDNPEGCGMSLVNDGRIEMVDVDGGRVLRATVGFAAGSVVASLGVARVVAAPERYSIQVGASRHILPDPDYLRFLNHSCAPNVFVDCAEMSVKAIGCIRPGDSLEYFYPSTEWSMREPFRCECGSSDCLGVIRGAAHLPAETLARYQLADHVRRLLTTRRAPRRRVPTAGAACPGIVRNAMAATDAPLA
jgi:SET domain